MIISLRNWAASLLFSAGLNYYNEDIWGARAGRYSVERCKTNILNQKVLNNEFKDPS